MLKRILSVFLSVVMIAGILMVPTMGVSALEKPANTAFANYGGYTVCGFTSVRDASVNTYTVTSPAEVDKSGTNATYIKAISMPAAGFWATFAKDAFTKDTTYVISFKVKNANPDVDTKVVFGLVDAAMGGASQNYAWKDQYVWTEDVTGDDWQTITKTVTLAYNSTSNTSLVAGLGMGNTHNSYMNRAELAHIPNSVLLVDVNSVYIAEESVYDITNELSSEIVLPGKTLTGSAAVVNQIEEKGSMDQTINYVVTTADGADAEGITVEEGSDGAYTIKATANAVPGNYKIVLSNDTNGETVENETPFTVAEKYLYDSVEGTDPLCGIEITAGGDYPNALGAFGTYTMTAALTDSEGEVGTNVQSFKWYAVTGDRTALAENFIITPSDDTTSATVKVNPDVEEGTYYIIAESTADESLGMLKGFEITVDKYKDIEAFGALLKSDESDAKTRIEESLETSIKLLELAETVVVSADEDALIALLMANADDAALDTKENIANYVLKSAIVSLYNTNPNEVALTGEDGGFAFADELELAYIDDDKVKIYALLEEVMSSEGLTALQSDVKSRKDYESIADFTDEVREQILLNAIQYPSSLGTGYMEKILTEDNINAVGIDATGYLALNDDDKKVINADLARDEYTLTALEEVLKDAEAPEGGDGGSDGGSTGGSTGGSRKPNGIGTTIVVEPEAEDDEETEEASKEQTFADVPASHWAYSDIYFLKEIGAISGVTEDTFNPEGKVTREQFIKMVIDALKIDHKANTASFEDVDASAWYATYVATGVAEGITTGKNSKVFGVGEAITRQDVCAMIVRALGMEIPESSKPTFKDAGDIASYAQGAVAVLTEYAVINGFGDNTFRGSDVCTRAQAAKIIANALNVANVLNSERGE